MLSWHNFATKNSGYRRYFTHRLLLDLNSKDRDIAPINRHVTRHLIKSNDSIALLWEVAFELHLLPPSDFNSTIVVKMS